MQTTDSTLQAISKRNFALGCFALCGLLKSLTAHTFILYILLKAYSQKFFQPYVVLIFGLKKNVFLAL